MGCLGDHEYSIARLSVILNPYVPTYLVASTIDVGGAFETDFESGTCIDAAEDVGVLDGLVSSAYGLDMPAWACLHVVHGTH